MLIKWEDLKVGDEVLIPSNSNLKYLKVERLGDNSHRCSFQKDVIDKIPCSYTHNGQIKHYDILKPLTCEPDISKHNAIFYLKNEGGYKDIWLIKREEL